MFALWHFMGNTLGMALDDYLDLAWLAPPESWDRSSQDSKRDVECKHSVLGSPAVRINFASAQLKEKKRNFNRFLNSNPRDDDDVASHRIMINPSN